LLCIRVHLNHRLLFRSRSQETERMHRLESLLKRKNEAKLEKGQASPPKLEKDQAIPPKLCTI